MILAKRYYCCKFFKIAIAEFHDNLNHFKDDYTEIFDYSKTIKNMIEIDNLGEMI